MDERRTRTRTRRRWLGTCATLAEVTALAGCSGGEETSDETDNGDGDEENGTEAESRRGEKRGRCLIDGGAEGLPPFPSISVRSEGIGITRNKYWISNQTFLDN